MPASGRAAEDAAPLTLEQRLPTPAEVPGYKPEPGDRQVFSDAAEFATSIQDALVQVTVKQATDVFKEGGFVSAISQDFSKEGAEDTSLSAVVIEFEVRNHRVPIKRQIHVPSV